MVEECRVKYNEEEPWQNDVECMKQSEVEPMQSNVEPSTVKQSHARLMQIQVEKSRARVE